MPYADRLRGFFPTLEPEVADLFALEAHQIADLPTRAPAGELAAVRAVSRESSSSGMAGASRRY